MNLFLIILSYSCFIAGTGVIRRGRTATSGYEKWAGIALACTGGFLLGVIL